MLDNLKEVSTKEYSKENYRNTKEVVIYETTSEFVTINKFDKDIIIPQQILNDLLFETDALKVLLYLWSQSDNYIIKQETVGKAVGLGNRKYMSAFNLLQDKGYVVITKLYDSVAKRKYAKYSVVKFVQSPQVQNACKENETTHAKRTNPVNMPQVQNAPTNTISINNKDAFLQEAKASVDNEKDKYIDINKGYINRVLKNLSGFINKGEIPKCYLSDIEIMYIKDTMIDKEVNNLSVKTILQTVGVN